MKPADLPATVLDRVAVVYVRQSSMTQVHGNLESQRRQYDLVKDARAYGFRNVEVIDDDLGTTASGVALRPGFQKLVGMVCAGNVGAVFSVEASRLARNGRDWHHLVELCGLVGARVIDLEGVYDPASPNDRLLLGLKGTMSEFELNVMRRRLNEARESKARRGELRLSPPIGYVWSTEGRRFEMEADRRVQEAIRLVFARFDELGSVNKVVRAMRRDGLAFPSPSSGRGSQQLTWRPPALRTLVGVLRNPFYAGAYAYGKSAAKTEIVEGRARRTYGHVRPISEWSVLIRDHHAAFVSWETFERNQVHLAGNAHRRKAGSPKSGRGGRALLTSLLRCRRCGRMLSVSYSGKGRTTVRYGCRGDQRQTPVFCLSVGAMRPDEIVAREVLKVVQPLAMEAALKAEEFAHEKHASARRLIELEVEQARYEARLAERRYEAVDPDKRLVAGELEARWESALVHVREVEARLAAPVATPTAIPDLHTLLGLAEDLGSVWESPQADMALKQRIIRVLIREIIVDVDTGSDEIVLVIHWVGGQHSELRVRKPATGEHRKRAPDEAVAVIRSMATRWSDGEIATTLNRMGLATGQAQSWTGRRVEGARKSRDIAAYQSANKDGTWLTQVEAAERLGVSRHTLRRLMSEGILPAHQVVKCAPWQIRAEDLKAPAVAEAVRRCANGPCRDNPPEQESLFTCVSRRDSQ